MTKRTDNKASVTGGTGNDSVSGNDSLEGAQGNDSLAGDTGNDSLTGNDVLSGDDTLTDTVGGTAGNDSVAGDEGNDTVGGGEGNDDLEHPLEGLADGPVFTVTPNAISGTAGQPVSGHFQAEGGKAPYTYVAENAVGLAVAEDGFFAANPEHAISGPVTLTITDADGASSTAEITFTVA